RGRARPERPLSDLRTADQETPRNAEALTPKGGSVMAIFSQHARSDSNRRLPASKASAKPGFAEGSASRGPDVASLVQVLQDIRDGRYKPDAPLVHGLTMALDRLLDAA